MNLTDIHIAGILAEENSALQGDRSILLGSLLSVSCISLAFNAVLIWIACCRGSKGHEGPCKECEKRAIDPRVLREQKLQQILAL